jgi:aminopeptidase N
MESVSKQDLSWFFSEWLTRPTSPSFDGGWRYDAAKKQVVVDLTQTQPGDPYRMPFEIGITEGGATPATRIERLEMTKKQSVFAIGAETEPATVSFDPNTWLLMDAVTFVKRP